MGIQPKKKDQTKPSPTQTVNSISLLDEPRAQRMNLNNSIVFLALLLADNPDNPDCG